MTGGTNVGVFVVYEDGHGSLGVFVWLIGLLVSF